MTFEKIFYNGKEVSFKPRPYYTKVDLIMTKNQPKDGSHIRLDMRYTVNKKFAAGTLTKEDVAKFYKKAKNL